MKTTNKILLILLMVMFYNCEDIIEKDISNKTVTVNYPQNNEQIESNVVNFQWDEMEGADNYRIRVFSKNENIILDSLVNNNFTYSLNPGNYYWKIRAENFAYQSKYTSERNFTIIETSDLTNQQVQLSNPATDYYKNTTFTFSWISIKAAETYDFQLVNVTNGNNIIHTELGLVDTSFTLPTGIITQDAQYLWKIRAINSTSSTLFTSRIFYIDTTVPNQPQNSLPINNATNSTDQSVNFEWNAFTDTGTIISPVSYTIQIASNQNFSTIIHTHTDPNLSYNYQFVTNGNYYWRVRATDSAGNQSSFSSPFKLVIQ